MRKLSGFPATAAAAVLACTLQACANIDGPKFSPAPPAPAGMATLYIFSPPSGGWPLTYIDDAKIGGSWSGAYTYVYIQPGTYKIRTEPIDTPGEITIEGTADHYLAYVVDRPTFVSAVIGTFPLERKGPLRAYWRTYGDLGALRYLADKPYQPAATQEVRKQP